VNEEHHMFDGDGDRDEVEDELEMTLETTDPFTEENQTKYAVDHLQGVNNAINEKEKKKKKKKRGLSLLGRCNNVAERIDNPSEEQEEQEQEKRKVSKKRRRIGWNDSIVIPDSSNHILHQNESMEKWKWGKRLEEESEKEENNNNKISMKKIEPKRIEDSETTLPPWSIVTDQSSHHFNTQMSQIQKENSNQNENENENEDVGFGNKSRTIEEEEEDILRRCNEDTLLKDIGSIYQTNQIFVGDLNIGDFIRMRDFVLQMHRQKNNHQNRNSYNCVGDDPHSSNSVPILVFDVFQQMDFVREGKLFLP